MMNYDEGDFFESLMQIFEILLNLGFSLIYFFYMIIFSFAIFLNLIAAIRNNFVFSFLTFLGIPIVYTTYMFYHFTFKIPLIFSTIYLFILLVEFLFFRRKINKLLLTNNQ